MRRYRLLDNGPILERFPIYGFRLIWGYKGVRSGDGAFFFYPNQPTGWFTIWGDSG